MTGVQAPGRRFFMNIVSCALAVATASVLMTSTAQADDPGLALAQRVYDRADGQDATSAVKAAVMVEEVARTVAAAEQIGKPVPVAQEHIDSLYARYQNVYGQH